MNAGPQKYDGTRSWRGKFGPALGRVTQEPRLVGRPCILPVISQYLPFGSRPDSYCSDPQFLNTVRVTRH